MTMEPWMLSDGTEVRLGGVVTGESFNALSLRAMFTDVRAGARYNSRFGPTPHEFALDLNVDYLLDSYLRYNFESEVTSGPLIVYPVLEPREPPDDGSVY
jgi:hypothetical protein